MPSTSNGGTTLRSRGTGIASSSKLRDHDDASEPNAFAAPDSEDERTALLGLSGSDGKAKGKKGKKGASAAGRDDEAEEYEHLKKVSFMPCIF